MYKLQLELGGREDNFNVTFVDSALYFDQHVNKATSILAVIRRPCQSFSGKTLLPQVFTMKSLEICSTGLVPCKFKHVELFEIVQRRATKQPPVLAV